MTLRRARQSAALTVLTVAMLVCAAGASLIAGPGLRGLLGAFLAVTVAAIAVSDARNWIIPDELSAAAFLLGLLHVIVTAPNGASGAALAEAMARSAIAGLLFYGLLIGYRLMRGRDGLGLGDVKLAAAAGVWLDWLALAAAVELAALSALIAYAVASLVTGRPLKNSAALPLGLFLAPSIWLGWLGATVLGR